MKFLFGVIVLLFICVAGYGWLEGDGSRYFHLDAPAEAAQPGVLAAVALAIATLTGLFCGTLFERLRNHHSDKVRWRPLLKGFLTHRRTVMGMLVSPIIFFAILKLVGNSVDDAGDLLLAFQNGFFWESVFATVGASYVPSRQEAAAG